MTGVGDIVVRASQEGNDLFTAAPDVDRTILVEQGTQLIRFAEIPPVRFGDAPVKVMASSSAGLPVSFEVVSGPGELTGNLLTFNGAGVIRVSGLQGGNIEYLPAAALLDIAVEKALQSITFTPPSYIFVGSSITLVATTSSGLPVNFEVLSGPGTLGPGGVLNAESEGDLLINAIQWGDNNYEPAPAAQRPIRVMALPRLAISQTPNGVKVTWDEQTVPMTIERAEHVLGPWEIEEIAGAGGGAKEFSSVGDARFFRCRVDDL